MKIIFAPDKFKSCMTAVRICTILEESFRKIFPDAEFVSLPMADGGDGTVEALLAAARGERHTRTVRGPLGRAVSASFGVIRGGGTAVIEMASASGIALLSREELDPRRASTYGTGELILAALDLGVREIILGIGGSATTDGGAGMAAALGYKLLDRAGKTLAPGGAPLADLETIDASGADPRLKNVRIRVACDVTSPLLGPEGAARVFSPQKGADPECVKELEGALARLSEIWNREAMLTPREMPGDGAAGGLGAGLRAFCGARPESGAKLVMEALDFEKHLSGASLVLTGEGRTDSQTNAGKLCGEIAKAAHAKNVPVILVSGALDGTSEDFSPLFDAAFSISPGRTSLADALAHGEDDLRFFAENLARALALGKEL